VRAWRAEVVVDAALARKLLAQFPELTVESLRPLAEGWDRTVWLVNEKWVFGFPRRAMVVPGVELEMAALPRLASLLPLPIPTPVFSGRPAHGYPWAFFGAAFLPGREAGEAGLDDDARIRTALELVPFLRRLHGREVAEAVRDYELAVDPTRRADSAHRARLAREHLAELESAGLWQPPASAQSLLQAGERLPPSSEACAVVHGDLHFRHLLVDDGRLSGVIDWIDLCHADPAIDLQLVWSFVPPRGRARFLDAYGPVTDEQLLRARVFALQLSAVLARYGHEENMPSVLREALGGLARTVAQS
jgi:aminoglycoside phosphotransferase (APT) family kinase protein